jgi:hypothetical protein
VFVVSPIVLNTPLVTRDVIETGAVIGPVVVLRAAPYAATSNVGEVVVVTDGATRLFVYAPTTSMAEPPEIATMFIVPQYQLVPVCVTEVSEAPAVFVIIRQRQPSPEKEYSLAR